jgi:hypothetical protein
MARLQRRGSGAWGARITIPKDVRPDYQTLYNKSVEEIFYAAPDYSAPRAQALFLRWQGDIKTRIAVLRDKQRGAGHDLTQKETYALAGEWYQWFVDQHDEYPGKAHHCAFDRTWHDLVLTCQIFVGAFLGIAAQFVLAIGVIFYVLPWMGLELLDTVRAVAEFDLPMKVLGLWWGNP